MGFFPRDAIRKKKPMKKNDKWSWKNEDAQPETSHKRKKKNKKKNKENAGFICFQCVMLSYTANINARQRLE